jgi:hypothetical protein
LADKAWALPLCVGDFDPTADVSPLGFHYSVKLASPSFHSRVMNSLCDQELSDHLKNVLVDAQNISGALGVLQRAEVLIAFYVLL